jgi:hypothetical protein
MVPLSRGDDVEVAGSAAGKPRSCRLLGKTMRKIKRISAHGRRPSERPDVTMGRDRDPAQRESAAPRCDREEFLDQGRVEDFKARSDLR